MHGPLRATPHPLSASLPQSNILIGLIGMMINIG
jgi:hypothetical protein